MTDIVVTTPRNQMENAVREAEEIKAAGGGVYFRILSRWPKELKVGERVWYVEDGFLRGYCVVKFIRAEDARTCETTGKQWKGGVAVLMDATTWRWIEPVPMKGFQGWRYMRKPPFHKEVGGWLDPKPSVRV